MSFNSLSFVWLFVPCVLVGFYGVVPREWRRHFLVAASFVFYGLSGPGYLLLLLVDILWVHAVTRGAGYVKNRLRLCLAISLPIAFLLYFKYLTFILEDVIGVPAGLLRGTFLESVVLPIGISFFTFELISYAIDRYRGEIRQPASLVDFTLFVTFFPHLVAGPILRFGNVAAQFADLSAFRLTRDEAQQAIVQIALGLALKILLADWLALHIGQLKADLNSLTGPGAVFLIFGFSYQIYFDFFGYSLIAIGLGRLLGIRLPDNFQLPYEALNPRQFWRRWHMSLSFWLRDYLYFPLGGNKRYVRNILIVFIVCGIWHGAGWRFAVWGLAHAALVIGYHACAPQWDRMPSLVQRVLTFVLVSIAWLPFLFDLEQARRVLGAFAVWSGGTTVSANAWLALAAAAGACLLADPDRILRFLRRSFAAQAVGGALAGAALASCLLFFDRTAPFIYFRF